MNFSVIVPFYNEEKNINTLHKELTLSLKGIRKKHKFELIYIDDGSHDKTCKELLKLKKNLNFINFF